MKKALLAVVTAAAVGAAALVPSGPAVRAATQTATGSAPRGFGSALSSVQQTTWQTNASVNTLAVAGNLVFAGGLFTRVRPPGKARGVGDVARKYFAVFDRTTGVPTRFAPQVNGQVWSVATSPDGRRVVIGGDFTVVDGVPRSRVAMFDVASGKLVAGWDPVVNYRVAALKISSDTVYLGGSFGSVDKVARSRVAAVSLNSGALQAWSPNANDDVHAIELSTDGKRAFVGGGFTRIGGRDVHALAMVNAATGAALPMPAAAAIPPKSEECDSRVKDLEVQGNKVFASNAGTNSVGCYDGVLAADATTGKLLWQSKCRGATEAIKAIGNWLYKGSHAHDCSADGAFPDKTGMHHFLVYSAITGKLGPWFPNATAGGTTLVGPLAFASGGNDLWAGGDFTKVNGVPQEGLTRFTNTPGGAAPARPAAPKVASARVNKVTIAVPTVLDRDNLTLTYLVYRGSTRIASWSRTSNSWTKPTVTSITDSGLTSGRKVSYHVEVSDGRNVQKSPSVAVRVR
ncbi:fibronectin type III domain-containing protein [Kribbella speibonae]|uniref:Fibronectin type III domain-containing protein n=1 Tax=Kribbella speibonae TaxID=1572660 RepID=A0ABY2AFS2_9ACTN|nr:fibronectin type III domain-containing protein [Kribbella speibonae]TCC27161.1 fibronectin type III domain-containing protein [Kribbella speibonae]